MPRMLILICPKCRKVREARDSVRSNVLELGKAIQRAEKANLAIELRDGHVEIGCECKEEGQPKSRSNRQFNMRQILLLVTTVAVLLAVVQHPINQILSASDAERQWASVPWSLYGWLFFGTEIIDPKQLPKSLLGIILFLFNVLVAIALPFVAAFLGKYVFSWSWNRIATDGASSSKTD